MPWNLYDNLTYFPNFSSRVAAHGASGLVWISNNTSPPNYAIQYDVPGKVENVISLEIANGGANYKGSNPGNFAISSDGTNIFGVSDHGADLAGGGSDHPVWDHSTGTSWTEDDDLGPNAGSYQVRMFHSDGRFYIPKSWSDVSNNPNVLCWTSTDGINWVGEQLDPVSAITAYSGRFLNNAVPVFVKLSSGNVYVSGTPNAFNWQFFKRVGTSWEAVGTLMNSFSVQGVDMFAMGANESFTRLYRQVISGTRRLQYSDDEGLSWNDCVASNNSETILATEMGGAAVVYAHSGREFISFNRTVSPSNHIYSLYEFNPISKEFDYIDDMPNDSASFQGAFVYNSELYIVHSDAIWKHDNLSFGGGVATAYDLKVSRGISRHAMDSDHGGDNVFFALEDDTSGDQKIYKEDVINLLTELIYDPGDGTDGNVYRIPGTETMLFTGLFATANNAQLYDIPGDLLTDISFGSSIIQPAIVSPFGKIFALQSDDVISRSVAGVWSNISSGIGTQLSSGGEAIAAIFFNNFLPDYIFVAGTDDVGDKTLFFTPNEMDDIEDLGASVWGDGDGTPLITGLDIAFDGGNV